MIDPILYSREERYFWGEYGLQEKPRNPGRPVGALDKREEKLFDPRMLDASIQALFDRVHELGKLVLALQANEKAASKEAIAFAHKVSDLRIEVDALNSEVHTLRYDAGQI